MKQLFVLLPAYNEEKDLESLLAHILDVSHPLKKEHPEIQLQILLVDDGSTDGTVSVAQSFGNRLAILLEKQPFNSGLGRTMKRGLQKVLSLANPEDIVVTMDADDTHPPGLILPMLEKINEGNDLVVASRYITGGHELGLRFHRRILSWTCNKTLSILFPKQNLRDYSTGYRMFTVSLLKRMSKKTQDRLFNSDGFSSTPELLLNLLEESPHCAEVPLVLRYDQKKGPSKMRVLPTIVQYASLILQRVLKKV